MHTGLHRTLLAVETEDEPDHPWGVPCLTADEQEGRATSPSHAWLATTPLTTPSRRPRSSTAAMPATSRNSTPNIRTILRPFPREWRGFFAELGDNAETAIANARGASWKKAHWPIPENGELTSALDGHWADEEHPAPAKVEKAIVADAQASGTVLDAAAVEQATRDSIRAIMMVRAYRMRGHLHAKLDPARPLRPAR